MTQLVGTIRAWEAEELEDRSAVVVPHCWVSSDGGSERQAGPSAGGALVAAGEATGLIPDVGRDDVLLALLATKPPRVLLDAVLAAADRGARVYLLAEAGFGEGGAGRELAKKSKARVLIRRVKGLSGSAVLADRGRSGGLFLGPKPSEEPTWFLALSADQGEALFRLALRMFWHEATDEAWTSSKGLRFASPRARPFDVPLPAPGAPVSLGEDAGSSNGSSVWHSPSGSLPSGRPQIVLVPPGGDGQDALAASVRGGSKVAWSSLGLPTLSATPRSGRLLLASDRFPLQVQLEEDQAAAVEKVLVGAAEAAPWRFEVDTALGVLDGRVWLPGAGSPKPPRARHDQHCGSVQADSLAGVTSTASPKRPQPPPLAKSVAWRWTVKPPRAPAAAKNDPLIGAWQKLDDETDDRLQSVRSRLVGVGEREGAIGKAFAALAVALKGFGRTRGALRKKTDELGASRPSTLGPEAATRLLASLAELETKAEALGEQVDEAERKAQEDKEHEQQRREFDKRQRQAEKDLATHTGQREKRQTELDKAQVELGEFAKVAQEGMPRKERRALQKKLDAAAEQARKRLSAAEQRVQDAEAVLAKEFEFRPSRRPAKSSKGRGKGARFVPSAKPKKTVSSPAEALPRVGELLSYKGERYLAITTWEQLDDGEAEAKRLKARLVAPAEK